VCATPLPFAHDGAVQFRRAAIGPFWWRSAANRRRSCEFAGRAALFGFAPLLFQASAREGASEQLALSRAEADFDFVADALVNVPQVAEGTLEHRVGRVTNTPGRRKRCKYGPFDYQLPIAFIVVIPFSLALLY
jgi:hypothetical protein